MSDKLVANDVSMTVERVEDGGVVSTRDGAFGYAEVHIEDDEHALFVGSSPCLATTATSPTTSHSRESTAVT